MTPLYAGTGTMTANECLGTKESKKKKGILHLEAHKENMYELQEQR